MTSGSDMLAALAGRGLVQRMAEAAIAAGAEILRVRACGVEGRLKADRTPVTEADEAAERVILPLLAEAFPDIPAISEEATSAGCVPEHAGVFFLVDPLDGTREFMAGRDEFTVNIGLVADGRPVAGVVYAPVSGRLWIGETLRGLPSARVGALPAGEPAPAVETLSALSCPPVGPFPAVALVSRSHGDPRVDAFLARHGVAERLPMGSSVKFCLLAEGRASVYPRFGRTMEWDTAAGDAVLRAAGGATLDSSGRLLVYGKPGFENGDFTAWARWPQ